MILSSMKMKIKETLMEINLNLLSLNMMPNQACHENENKGNINGN
jgi:hypothetical protein